MVVAWSLLNLDWFEERVLRGTLAGLDSSGMSRVVISARGFHVGFGTKRWSRLAAALSLEASFEASATLYWNTIIETKRVPDLGSTWKVESFQPASVVVIRDSNEHPWR